MKRLLKLFEVLTVVFLMAGCDHSRERDNFTVHSSGLEYKFVEMNPSGESPKKGDILVLSFGIYTEDGKLVESNDFYRLQLAQAVYQGDFFTGLSMIQVGDSIVFKLDAVSYYEKTRKRDLPGDFDIGDPVIIRLRLKSILSQEDLEQERQGIYHTSESQEMELLHDYILNANIKKRPNDSGLYVIIRSSGPGRIALPGDTLKVHYTGTTIDGKIFDSSLQRNNPISFVLGKEQVIKGWDEGFNGLKEGTKGRLIIPSKLAYGKEGYKTLIQPYSTLIFEFEILEVK